MTFAQSILAAVIGSLPAGLILQYIFASSEEKREFIFYTVHYPFFLIKSLIISLAAIIPLLFYANSDTCYKAELNKWQNKITYYEKQMDEFKSDNSDIYERQMKSFQTKRDYAQKRYNHYLKEWDDANKFEIERKGLKKYYQN